MNVQNALVAFDPKAIATFGNQMLAVIVQHEDDRAAAELALQQATEREKVIDFELTRVALYLHRDEKIDLFNVMQKDKNLSSTLYRSILVETGALNRKIDDATDKVIYEFTEDALKDKFYFDDELKEKDEEEFKRRRSRRNALNMRLARVCKAALALFEAEATPDDMQITQNEETGELQAVITKGPKELMGEEGNVQIHSKNAAPVKGASATPTIGGLAKLTEATHAPKDEPKSKAKTETSNRGEAADFTAVMNAAIMAIKAKEGKFTKAETTLLNNLEAEITNAKAAK